MTIDDETLFFEGATIQEALPPSTDPATAGNGIICVDIMSNKPLTDTEAQIALTLGNLNSSSVVGGTATLTFDQTIYMRHRIFNMDLDNLAGGYMITLSDHQLGSLSPTASDRVYCTRVISIGGEGGSYALYPVRYILRGTGKEEPEYQYLMRLKRSFDLQNEPDRD